MADIQEDPVHKPVPVEEKKLENVTTKSEGDNGDGTGAAEDREGETEGESKPETEKLRMDQFVFDDEKPKKKAKKAKKKPPKRPSRREYEATLIELNGVLADLRKKASKLDDVNYMHNEKLVNILERHKEVSEHLKRVQKKHLQSLTIEEEYNEEIIKKRQDHDTEGQARILDLQKQFKQTESQLLGEIDMVGTKLSTLRVFSDARDEMLEKLDNMEIEYKQSDSAFQDRLYAMLQKNVVERNNTDKEGKARYERIIDDFTQSREVRNAAYTRRLLSENSELRRKYNKLIPINLRKELKLKRLLEKTSIAKETYAVVNDITQQLERTQQKRDELIEKLKKIYNFYKLQVVTGSKYRRMFDALKDHEIKESSKYQNTENLAEDISKHTAALHEKYQALKQAEREYFYHKQQHDHFVDAVKRATLALCDLPEYSHLYPKSFRAYVAKRDGIVRGLIEIITNCERKIESEAMLKSKYYKGYLGFMPLDYVMCEMLRESCCTSPKDLKWIPSYCQRAIKYRTKQDDTPEELSISPSDPALQCLR